LTTERFVYDDSPLRLETVVPTPVPHVSVEIRDTAHRLLVTAIEVLSPSNEQGEGCSETLANGEGFSVLRPI